MSHAGAVIEWRLQVCFAAQCLKPGARPGAVRDVAAVLIASVETTANMVAWCLVRWALAPLSERPDIKDFAREIEVLDSPNTIVVRRAVAAMSFQGATLPPGTLVAYSPASPTGSADQVLGQIDPLTFGSGSRVCPGRSMARYIVECTVRSVAAQPSPWIVLSGELPRPVAWFPIRTFGPGTMMRTGP